jgi:hypothetical protein
MAEVISVTPQSVFGTCDNPSTGKKRNEAEISEELFNHQVIHTPSSIQSHLVKPLHSSCKKYTNSSKEENKALCA